jgi:hypothetical protein
MEFLIFFHLALMTHIIPYDVRFYNMTITLFRPHLVGGIIPLEWNDYSYGIVIFLFGSGLFFGIGIPIRILRARLVCGIDPRNGMTIP